MEVVTLEDKTMTKESRLKMILAYEFSESTCYEACDIPTRARIDRLVSKISKLFPDYTSESAATFNQQAEAFRTGQY